MIMLLKVESEIEKKDLNVQLFIFKPNDLFYRSDCSLFQFGCIYYALL